MEWQMVRAKMCSGVVYCVTKAMPRHETVVSVYASTETYTAHAAIDLQFHMNRRTCSHINSPSFVVAQVLYSQQWTIR